MRLPDLILVPLAVAALAGCSLIERGEIRKAQAAADTTVPRCRGAADCKAKWEAARRWVVANSAFPVQTATDELIDTGSPAEMDTRLTARVTKEPQDNGDYKILVNVWCGNPDGCEVNPAVAALDFNRVVNAAAVHQGR
jgi:hypothetical protein